MEARGTGGGVGGAPTNTGSRLWEYYGSHQPPHTPNQGAGAAELAWGATRSSRDCYRKGARSQAAGDHPFSESGGQQSRLVHHTESG